MFEHHTHRLLSSSRFVRRMLKFLLLGAAVDAAVVVLGAVALRLTEGLGWLDALLDAAMVMTGNGPRHPVVSPVAKVFVALYALVGGTTYIIVVAMVLAPALHRLLHAFHLRAPEDP